MRTCIELSRNFGRWPTRLLTADLQRRLLRCRVPQKIILALVDQPVLRGTEWSFLRFDDTDQSDGHFGLRVLVEQGRKSARVVADGMPQFPSPATC